MSQYGLFYGLARQKHHSVLLLLLLLVKGFTCSNLSELRSRCTGNKVCLKYDANNEIENTVYWYYRATEQCLLLSKRCIQPNLNNTFRTLQECNNTCKGEEINNHVHNCGNGGTGCEQDLPPTSNTTTRSSISPVITIGCAIGGIALVAIIIAGVIMAKRRKKIQKRRYVEDMLHMWSSNSDDSYDSYEDNPEDNNLFDRLERNL